MYIENTDATTVPFGKYEGYDLQEMVELDRRYAKWMLNETSLRRDYPDHYYDLDFYLRAAGLYRSLSMRY